MSGLLSMVRMVQAKQDFYMEGRADLRLQSSISTTRSTSSTAPSPSSARPRPVPR
jgi:hypothetical protein